MNVFTVNGSSSAIADPWYCPNCVNKQDVPTYEQLRTQLAEAEEQLNDPRRWIEAHADKVEFAVRVICWKGYPEHAPDNIEPHVRWIQERYNELTCTCGFEKASIVARSEWFFDYLAETKVEGK